MTSSLLLYVSDVQNVFTSATRKLFADNRIIFLFGKDLKGLLSTAKIELASLSEWLLANKLTFSISQDKDTKFTLFANKSPANSTNYHSKAMKFLLQLQ